MTYFNTTYLQGEKLAERRRKAGSLEVVILNLFLAHPDRMMTPSEVWRVVGSSKGWPLTSVRRAMTMLTKAGELVKTEQTNEGSMGAPAHCWRLAGRQPKQLQSFGEI